LLVLDTMVLTWITDPRGRRPDWQSFVAGRTLVLTFVTVGEILHGASNWSAAHVGEVEQRLASYPVIPGTIGVARQFAALRRRFFDQIGDNDIWIAACLLSQTVPIQLTTEDTGFARIADAFPLVVVKP
jgi:predicted nucleic acid-binding protein